MDCFRKIYRSLPLGAALWLVILAAGCSGDRTPAAVLLNQAVDDARKGNWQEAFQLAQNVLKREAAHPEALVIHAIAAEKLGRIDLALNSARKAAELHPEHFAAQYTLGRMLCDRPGGAAEAMQPLERALKARPGDPNTLLLLGRAASRINADKTIDYYQMLPAEIRNRPEVQNQIAVYYLARRGADRNNLARAQQALAKAYNGAPRNPQIVHNLALYLDYCIPDKGKTVDQYQKAIGFYDRYLKLTVHNPELNPERAQVQARKSKLEAKLRELKR